MDGTTFFRDLDRMEEEVLAKPKGSLKAFVSWFGVDFCNPRLNPSEKLGLDSLIGRDRDASTCENWLLHYSQDIGYHLPANKSNSKVKEVAVL